jgi:hypothetical protein
MAEQERLIDLSPPLGHSNSEHPSFHAVSSPGAHSRETSNSSDTVIRTPHRRSFANLSPAALELFENGINFPSPDEFRLDGDLLADPTPGILTCDTQTQTALLGIKDPQEIQETQASSATSRDRTDQKPSHEPFLDKNLIEETEPGGTTVTQISTNNQSLPDPLMATDLSTPNLNTRLTTGRGDLATPSCHEIIPRENSMRGSTLSRGRSIILPTILEPTVTSSLENKYQHTPDWKYHQVPTRRV